MTKHEDVSDVSDGDQVIAGVEPPTAAELAEAKELSFNELKQKAAIDAHVAEVNIHDGRHS